MDRTTCRKCSGCRVTFPATTDYFNRNGSSRLKARCKYCEKGDTHRRKLEGPLPARPASDSSARAKGLLRVMRKHGLVE